MRLPNWLRRKTCAEDGHQWEAVTRRGWARSGADGKYHFRCVADRVTQVATRCRRCKALEDDWETTRSSCLQGLTIASEKMDQLETEGFVRSD